LSNQQAARRLVPPDEGRPSWATHGFAGGGRPQHAPARIADPYKTYSMNLQKYFPVDIEFSRDGGSYACVLSFTSQKIGLGGREL
jgi:hypothetical protein